MEWKSDWGLRGRMVLTMFLLFALYIVFILVLSQYMGLFGVVVVMGLFSLGQFFFSDRLALYSMGASTVEESEYPQLHATVGRLSQQADLPKPTVAVADTRVPNAFATGRSPSKSTVCVTQGLLQTLDEEELEGVLAHELAHVKNRDVMVMTIASFLSTIAFLIVRWGWLFGGGRNRQGGGGMIVAILVSLVVWIVSFVLIRTLSRYREYAADRGGAAITGNPSALASALLTISGRMDRVPNAFATGRSPSKSTVCVTQGLLQTLDEEELEGVLAHELAHVKNRDVMVMTIASFLSTIAFIIVRWGWLFGGGRNRQGGGGMVVAVLVSLVVWIVSFVLIRTLSRYREYSADRGGAAITGNPSALASALLTISGRMDHVPKEDLREQSEMNAFFVIPIRSDFVGRIFSTHPPTEKRVERLREMAGEMER